MSKSNVGETLVGKDTAESPSVFDAPSYYTNAVRITLGKYDIRIQFSEMLPTEKQDTFALKPQASVVMSHEHAKSMLDVLHDLIEANVDSLNLRQIYFPGKKRK